MCSKRAYRNHWNQHLSNKLGSYDRHSRKKAWKESFKAALNSPPANVKEADDKYELYLFAPWFEKSDFIISVTDKTLSISVERKTEEDENWKRQEYTPQRFERKFDLGEKIDVANITAKYEKGVLILTLPKSAGFETKRQEITVA